MPSCRAKRQTERSPFQKLCVVLSSHDSFMGNDYCLVSPRRARAKTRKATAPPGSFYAASFTSVNGNRTAQSYVRYFASARASRDEEAQNLKNKLCARARIRGKFPAPPFLLPPPPPRHLPRDPLTPRVGRVSINTSRAHSPGQGNLWRDRSRNFKSQKIPSAARYISACPTRA